MRRRPQRLDGGEDRRQRGAQVVADGPQQRRLDDVAAAQGARLDDVGEQLVALQGGREHGLERGDHALLQAPQRRLGQPGRQDERAELARSLAQGEHEPPLVGLDGRELDRGGRQLQRAGQALRRGRQRRGQVVAAQQQPRHLGREVGLAPALLGLGRAVARALGQRAGHGRGDEEDAEPDPVLAVGDREAAGRRQVEEVEGERADHRGQDPEQAPQPPTPAARPAGRARPAT